MVTTQLKAHPTTNEEDEQHLHHIDTVFILNDFILQLKSSRKSEYNIRVCPARFKVFLCLFYFYTLDNPDCLARFSPHLFVIK